MSISFETFRSIYRECYSTEFKDVPENEDSINYTFSNRFTKRTERLIRRQKSIYWCLINRVWKIILIFVLVLSLLCGVAFYYNSGTVIHGNDDDPSSSQASETIKDDTYSFSFESDYILDDNGNIVGELFSDKKASIFNSMINSFYYFNTAHLFIELALPYGTVTEIEYTVDLKNGASNENVYVNGEVVSFSYSDGKELIIRALDKNEFNKDAYPVYLKDEEKYIPLKNRIYVDKNGNPSFLYRNNVTNCPNAEYCLLPQKLAFEYLSDFDAWDISDSYMVLMGRHCTLITGHKKDKEFTFSVDSATGILMHYEVATNGTITEMMNVKECVIDGDAQIFVGEEEVFYNAING